MGSNHQPRSFKFYRKNEEEVMRTLGLKPTKNSGSTWIEKEDGQSDYVICQLKSTDAQSIKVNQKDIRTLEVNADIAHKIPLFAIQFLNTDEVWLMVKPIDIKEVAKYIETGRCERPENLIDYEESTIKKVKKIKSSKNARDKFFKEKEDKYRKENKAWK